MSVTASGCIEFQSYTCISSTSFSVPRSVGAASDKLRRRLRRLLRSSLRCNPHGIQERHMLAQLSPDLLDRMSLLALARGVKPGPPSFVFRDPLAGIFATLN